MDTRTGEIKELKDINKELLEHFVEVSENEMTEKQREEKIVNLQDHASKLGKKLTEERKKRGLTYNKYRKLKRQGKLR